VSHPATHTAAPSSPSASAQATAAAKANDRALVYGEAASILTLPSVRPALAGPVMVPYAQFEATLTAAAASAGSPFPAAAVTPIPGGYNLCGDNGSGGTTCTAYTAFQHNAAGRITGVSVNGQPVAGRLSTGPDNAGPGLAITHVVAYRLTGTGQAAVSFMVKNTGSTALSGSPPFLAVLNPPGGGQYQEDDTHSALPGSLQPGESAAAVAVFDTPEFTGRFTLRSNDQLMSVLAGTTLSKVAS
jgi:hypothetical protein